MKRKVYCNQWAIQVDSNTWIVPEGWKLVKVEKELMERLRDMCEKTECYDCPFCHKEEDKQECEFADFYPMDWNIDVIRERMKNV